MATILLSTAGAAVGGSLGGTVAGLSSVAVGRAFGATLGRVIDQRLLGQGAQAVETGKVDRFRLTQAGEGSPLPQLYGRMRVGGQVIWASDFAQTTTVSGGGGKGAPATPRTTEYSYSLSLAIALCEGEITGISRIWADGALVAERDLNMSVYYGTRDQLPDPTISAIEGADNVPAYRGTAYVVMENLALGQFGNRVPQFSFEVTRPEATDAADTVESVTQAVNGVALIPGTGEYALATTPVHYADHNGARWSANVTTPAGKTDFAASVDNLVDEFPKLKAASLVVSWFGNDLRCGQCDVRPKVESSAIEAENMPWQVSDLTRPEAEVIAHEEDRPVYGGTPTDASVVEAIQAMSAAGKAVMFYPFILMDQLDNNALPDPYTDATSQAKLPWRGRITLSKAPGRAGSPDRTSVADEEVAAFFGTVKAADFDVTSGQVHYSGPDEWTFSRFILHYAALCAVAGGVDAFCIGTEMRGLTQIRGANDGFPAVSALRSLAAEARALLGSTTKISYAADWSEYFGYQPQDGNNDRYFHLDPLWADANIDFIGIDNYMPVSDWRDGHDHLDAQTWDTIYNLGYLQSNMEGGEGFDWFYHSPEARAAQIRTPITDEDADEAWIYRYKDIRSWWASTHHERVNGQRSDTKTAWIPESKPVWFTEYGCAAIDKGTNQPNKFLDLKSSESSLPRYSTGARDDLIQMQYLQAFNAYWNDPSHNPVSAEYGGPMIDMSRAFVWAWDARPYPYFPNNDVLWSDGSNYARGHWLNGRSSSYPLSSLVGEICRDAGVLAYDTSRLYGYVRGYVVDQISDARASLQPLMLRFGFDAVERDGCLVFVMRDKPGSVRLDPRTLAVSDELGGTTEQARETDAEIAGRVRLRFVQADGDFDAIAEEAVLADDATHSVVASELNMSLTRTEGRQILERWLAEARMSRETLRLALPPSQMELGTGDVVELPAEKGERDGLYRIDRVEQGEMQIVEAVRIEPTIYETASFADELAKIQPFTAPVPVTAVFLDLPLLRGNETPYAPYIAASATPWPGSVAVYQSSGTSGFGLNSILPIGATMGTTETELVAARPGVFDHGDGLQVRLNSGQLESVDETSLMNGMNLAAIGDGSADQWEIFQFEQAELVAPNTYRLSKRLRGQAGTDALMPPVWPQGSRFVLLNDVPVQITSSPNLRRVEQQYRIGPATRSYDDPSYIQLGAAFEGNGLRPLRPCHLRARVQTEDVVFNWIRRTRVGGDSWDSLEVPLAEENERYIIRLLQDGKVLRDAITTDPEWRYDAETRQSDGMAGAFKISVAQVSASYGAGPAALISVSF